MQAETIDVAQVVETQRARSHFEAGSYGKAFVSYRGLGDDAGMRRSFEAALGFGWIGLDLAKGAYEAFGDRRGLEMLCERAYSHTRSLEGAWLPYGFLRDCQKSEFKGGWENATEAVLFLEDREPLVRHLGQFERHLRYVIGRCDPSLRLPIEMFPPVGQNRLSAMYVDVLVRADDRALMVAQVVQALDALSSGEAVRLFDVSGWDTPEGLAAFGKIPPQTLRVVANGCRRDPRREFAYLVRAGAADLLREKDRFSAGVPRPDCLLAAGLLEAGQAPEEILDNQDVWRLFEEAERERQRRAELANWH